MEKSGNVSKCFGWAPVGQVASQSYFYGLNQTHYIIVKMCFWHKM